MTARPSMLAALCLGTLAAWKSATLSALNHYRLELKTTVVQDLTSLGQGEQRQEFSNTGFLSVSTQDSAGGTAVTFVLDSFVVGTGSPIPAEAAKTAAGATWHGFRGPGGRISEIKLERENQVAGVIEPAVQQLLPPLRAGARDGQSWTDTTDSGIEGISVRTVTNFQTSTDSYNGAKVLRLAGAFSSALSGQQESPQGTMSIEGNGTGINTWLVGTDGTCLSATHQANQNLTISVAQLPQPIPMTVRIEGNVTLLK